MFGFFVWNMFGLLISTVNDSNPKKCISSNNQQCILNLLFTNLLHIITNTIKFYATIKLQLI